MTLPEDYSQHGDRYYAREHLVRTFYDDFRHLADKSVLNAGCGRALSVQMNPLWWGFDFNPQLEGIWSFLNIRDRTAIADARRLDQTFPEGMFQFTVSCDFLEHLQPEDLPVVAAQLQRVAAHGVHVIDRAPESHYRSTTGDTLHPAGSISASEWEALFPGSTCTDHPRRGRSHFLLVY